MIELGTLIERCRAGDDLAWEALVKRLQGRVYGLAVHYVRDPDEARDLAQEIFVRMYQRLDTFTGNRSFLGWTTLLARNLCIDHLRRRKARPPASDVPADTAEGAAALPAAGSSPEAAWMTDRKSALLYRAMGKLSEQNREILLLKEIQGLKLGEIADMLNVPIGTVKSRSTRARVELARQVLAIDPSYAT